MASYRIRATTTTADLLSARGIVLAAALLVGCDAEKPSDAAALAAKTTPESKPVLVELARLERGRIEETLERSAPLEAEIQVEVQARTQNPAIELLVEEGDRVAEGQVLLRLESDRQKTAYEQSRSQLEQARIDFERFQTLYDQNLISESEYRNAKFALDQAQLQTENTERELAYTEVRAPIKGTISRRTVKAGDQVVTGTPLFEITDLESTVAVINVPEQYLPKLRPGIEARLRSSTLGDEPFAGFVKRVSPIVEARAGTVKVVVGVRDLGPLRPGMWVDVELVLDSKHDALLIPKRSIVYDNDQTFAFRAYSDEDGVLRAKRELVVPRNGDKEHIEPTAGFSVGELIVVAGHSGLKDESPIRALEDPSAATAVPAAAVAESGASSGAAVKRATAQGVQSP